MSTSPTVTTLAIILSAAFMDGCVGIAPGTVATTRAQAPGDATDAGPAPAGLADGDVRAPGKHHRYLDPLVGRWEAEFRSWSTPDVEPMLLRGTITREWTLGGRYVMETMETEGDVGAFRCTAFIGYNNFDRQYELIRMDDISTAMTIETGTFHPDTKILHMRGHQRDPRTGRVLNSWSKLDLSDPDRHVFTVNATNEDGYTYKAFEGVMERTN
jgi:hypothetical protein